MRDLHADAQGPHETRLDLHAEELVIALILLDPREEDLSLRKEGRTLLEEARSLHEDAPDLPRESLRKSLRQSRNRHLKKYQNKLTTHLLIIQTLAT